MAEVVAEDVVQTGQNDEDYLEVDLGVGNDEPEHAATNAATAAKDEIIETVTDDFDIEFDELDEGGDSAYPEPSHTMSADAHTGELGALQDNIAVSEIDYHENEGEDKLDQPSAHSIPLHESVDNENPEGGAKFFENDDEISYDHTAPATTDALDTRASPETEVDVGAEQEAGDSDLAQQGAAVAGDASRNVHQTEEPQLDDEESHKTDTVEDHIHDEKRGSENEHSGAHHDHSWNEDHQRPTHGVIATYKGREYELFASPSNNDPETYFFASTEELYCPLSQMFHGIRDILGTELHATDELLLAVEDLDLVIGSSSNEEFLEETTMHDILHLYLQLQLNDGVTDEPILFVQLMARSPCEERFRFLKNAAQEGRGLTEFYESPADSDMDIEMDMASDHAYDEESEGDVADLEGELKDEESGEMAHTEGAQESFPGEDANTTDEHTGESEHPLEGDSEVGVATVHEHSNGEALPHEDGDVHEARPEDDQQANNQAEDARETLGDQDQFGDNARGGATYDGDDHDNSTDLDTSTADHQRSDFHLANATKPSEDSGDETGEGLGDVVEQNGPGDVVSDAMTTGNDSLSLPSFAESPAATFEEMLDAYLESANDEISDGLWKQLYESPPVVILSYVGDDDEDLIDYSDDEDDNEVHESHPASSRGFQQAMASGSGYGVDLDSNLGDDEISVDGLDLDHRAATFRHLGAHIAEEDSIDDPDQADGSSVCTSSAHQDKTCQSPS
ncbi:hypothetical protein DL546_003909 [Coniochaeta pulveracea]|uniref:Uncharacterized protein n=1 Tax=Coniochaeta pulveracea TaxID=177199 RepID=A0A420Y4R1_9PEZI|nr:hypothetical protein DL546_003909 [Coniochaeta pulveracea]